MKRTGVFYHQVCGDKAYFTLAMSVREGFEILEKEKLLSEPNIILFESQPVSEEFIRKIHTQDWINSVKRGSYWETSLYSIGGLVQATKKVLKGEIDNALVYVGVGGHHAHRDHAWGGCFLNLTVIAIEYARERLGARRFAIIDTDTHHGDGTRDLVKADEDILHLCFCGWWDWNYDSPGQESKTKLCFSHGSSDEEEIDRVRKELPRVEAFKPELIYWVVGLDTHKDSYGTRSLTERCYPRLAEIIKACADKVCQGRLIVKCGCNAPAYVSEYAMPRVVNCLAERVFKRGDTSIAL